MPQLMGRESKAHCKGATAGREVACGHSRFPLSPPGTTTRGRALKSVRNARQIVLLSSLLCYQHRHAVAHHSNLRRYTGQILFSLFMNEKTEAPRD